MENSNTSRYSNAYHETLNLDSTNYKEMLEMSLDEAKMAMFVLCFRRGSILHRLNKTNRESENEWKNLTSTERRILFVDSLIQKIKKGRSVR